MTTEYSLQTILRSIKLSGQSPILPIRIPVSSGDRMIISTDLSTNTFQNPARFQRSWIKSLPELNTCSIIDQEKDWASKRLTRFFYPINKPYCTSCVNLSLFIHAFFHKTGKRLEYIGIDSGIFARRKSPNQCTRVAPFFRRFGHGRARSDYENRSWQGQPKARAVTMRANRLKFVVVIVYPECKLDLRLFCDCFFSI